MFFEKSTLPTDRRLRLYNQYPGQYDSFEEMMSHLDAVAELGFKQVWINPFFEACQHNPVNPSKTGSPYAMRSHLALDKERGFESDSQVKAYTKKCGDLGLSPLFDIVLNHVGIDHPFVENNRKAAPELFQSIPKEIDTSLWFKRFKETDKLYIEGYSPDYRERHPTAWDDIAVFDYDNEKVRAEIIQYFWKPFVKKMIAFYGFQGARIDAPARVHNEVMQEVTRYINELTMGCYSKEAYLVAETIGSKYDLDVAALHDTHVNFIMGSSYYTPYPDDGAYVPFWTQGYRPEGNWLDQSIGILSTIASQSSLGVACTSGSHDTKPIATVLKEKGIKDPIIMKQRILEKMLLGAFLGSGGHIVPYGTEWGNMIQVDLFNQSRTPIAKMKEEGLSVDLTQEIKTINQVIAQLPKPSSAQWSKRILSFECPELVIIAVFPKKGYEKAPYLIIANSYHPDTPELDKKIEITEEKIAAYLKTIGAPFESVSDLYLCGNVKATGALSDKMNVYHKAYDTQPDVQLKPGLLYS